MYNFLGYTALQPEVRSELKTIIPSWNLRQTLYFKSPYIGQCLFDRHFLVDEKNGAFVEQKVDEKPYIHLSSRTSFSYYIVYVSEIIFLLKIQIQEKNSCRNVGFMSVSALDKDYQILVYSS